jgi:HlyD family secretion protein
MVKNLAAVLATVAVAGGCAARGAGEDRLQGIVELDEVRLSFELGGRLAERKVQRGDRVEAGAVLARLDDTLARQQRDARAAEARAATAQRDLVVAGTRPEEVRSASAELRAAEALVTRLQGEVRRSGRLAVAGVEGSARTEELDADLTRAREQVAAQRERVRVLRGGARREEIALVEARVEAAAAALAAEDERLARHILHAPVAGRIVDVHAEPGEVVSTGGAVVTLADPRRPYIDVFVPQARVPAVHAGAAAQLRVDGEPRTFTARVEHVASETEFTPRFLFSPRERPNLVVRVRIRVDDPEERLHAGIPGFVTIEGVP